MGRSLALSILIVVGFVSTANSQSTSPFTRVIRGGITHHCPHNGSAAAIEACWKQLDVLLANWATGKINRVPSSALRCDFGNGSAAEIEHCTDVYNRIYRWYGINYTQHHWNVAQKRLKPQLLAQGWHY